MVYAFVYCFRALPWFQKTLSSIHTFLHILRISNECEDAIEKSVQRIAVWHHGACRLMTNDDRDGRIFLSHHHKNNELVFLPTTKYCILLF